MHSPELDINAQDFTPMPELAFPASSEQEITAPSVEADAAILIEETEKMLRLSAAETDSMRTERNDKQNGSGDDLFPTLKG